MGAALAEAGAEYVEAPVAGSAVQAEEATRLFGRAVDAGLGDLDAMAILDVLREG